MCRAHILCHLEIICIFIWYNNVFQHCYLLLPVPERTEKTFIRLVETLLNHHPSHSIFSVCWQSFGIHFSWNGGKSWLVSTKMIIPFSLPARVVIEPNFKHIQEVSDSLFLEKFSSTFKESCRVKWNLVLNISFSVCDACLSLSTVKENLRLAEQEDWRASEPPAEEPLHLWTVSFGKDYIYF